MRELLLQRMVNGWERGGGGGIIQCRGQASRDGTGSSIFSLAVL